MSMHPNHKILFEPVKLGPVTTRNRLYQVPHGPGAGNFPQIDVGIRGARAEGGWGVVCCEASTIHPSSDYNFLGMHRLWTAVERHKAIETLYHDAERASCIELPVFRR